ncbi:MAG: sel1 repeat family protein [bacterium]|nr:sel1 repeat family protein [bacterium]
MHRVCAVVLAVVFVASFSTRGHASEELASAVRLANAGDLEGMYSLGRLYELGREVDRDLLEAARQYRRAAERGHAEAQFALGLLLVGALPDAPRDEGKSFVWFQEAAQQGHPTAAYFLGMSYESGVGTRASSERAFDWYRRAASFGSAGATNAIARMYASGVGLQRNLPNAHAWNQVAVARGFEGAEDYASELEAKMSEKEIARAQRLAEGLLRKYGAAPDEAQP